MTGEIVKVEPINDNVLSFWFKPEPHFDYLAGQYTDIKLDNVPLSHWYTLSSSPTEDLCCFTTKLIEPLSLFKQTLLKLKPGDKFIYSEVIGDYVLPKDLSVPLIFIAGGIGITPVRSVIKYLIDKKEVRKIELFYAAHKESDLVFDDIFQEYEMNYMPILSATSHEWQGQIGPLSSERIIKHSLHINKNPLVFISGTQQMVEEMTEDLTKVIGRSRIIMDYFPGYL